MANVNPHQSPPSPLPTSTMPSTPLNLTGFLTQNSIHVEGDAGSIHFSGTFNIYDNQLFSPAIDLNGDNINNNLSSLRHTSSSYSSTFSSFVPNSIHEDQKDQFSSPKPSVHSDQFQGFETPEPILSSNSENGKCCHNSEMTIRTRLRSGVITPVSYCSTQSLSGELSAKKTKCRRKLSWEGRDLMQRMVRRSIFPVRPCSSYSLFVMDKWDSVKSNSFEETSKRLGELWSNLRGDEKKLYVGMAAEDSLRYKKQCSLLRQEDGLFD